MFIFYNIIIVRLLILISLIFAILIHRFQNFILIFSIIIQILILIN